MDPRPPPLPPSLLVSVTPVPHFICSHVLCAHRQTARSLIHTRSAFLQRRRRGFGCIRLESVYTVSWCALPRFRPVCIQRRARQTHAGRSARSSRGSLPLHDLSGRSPPRRILQQASSPTSRYGRWKQLFGRCTGVKTAAHGSGGPVPRAAVPPTGDEASGRSLFCWHLASCSSCC